MRHLHKPDCGGDIVKHDRVNAWVHERMIWGVENMRMILG
jgi:hypothetical protein